MRVNELDYYFYKLIYLNVITTVLKYSTHFVQI